MTIRDQFAAPFDRCFLCGTKAENTWPPRLESHDMARGPDREKSKNERCNLIRACPRCHTERLDGMPVVIQLAIKRLYDPDGYDRERVNILRGRAHNAITESEVLMEYYELQAAATSTGHPFPRWTW